MAEPSMPALASLFSDGCARVPERWNLNGPGQTGLWWRSSRSEVVATPALLRLATWLPKDGERMGLLLATEPRYRDCWLDIEAARLMDLGERGDEVSLCREIDVLGAAAKALVGRVRNVSRPKSGETATELALFGAPADQPAAAPGLLRVLGLSASLVEGGQGVPVPALSPVDERDPEINWVAGRLLQAPSPDARGSSGVLSGALQPCGDDRMQWVLETPWMTFLAVLAFTVEAWAAERQGGMQLELAPQHVQRFARPPESQVVVTLIDGREILCGTLGELCLRTLDALGMALVPVVDIAGLNQRLGAVIAELLRAAVWAWKPEARTRYVIGESFSFDCYRGVGHRYICLGSERLSQALRSVAVTWARTRADGSPAEAAA